MFTGAYAINPVNGQQIPVWIADYVLVTYGTGAIMAVPGGDERDYDFALKYGLPIVTVVAPAAERRSREATTPTIAPVYKGDSKIPRVRRAGHDGQFRARWTGCPPSESKDAAITLLEQRARARPPPTTACATG